MNGTLPTRRPSGQLIEQPLATVALGIIVSGMLAIGLTYAGVVAAKEAGERILSRVSTKLPLGPT